MRYIDPHLHTSLLDDGVMMKIALTGMEACVIPMLHCFNGIFEAHASSASDVSFMKDRSVDFVLANGLLCSMAEHRKEAVNEIRRILKGEGQAYLSLGAGHPFGYVDPAEWDNILEGFKVEQGGSYKEKWALVSAKQE
jgi:SAM-dependent methyltransferase